MEEQVADKAVQGGKHLGRVLRKEGVEFYFGITRGGHVFPIQVGMGMAGIKLLHMRHEQAGAYAAAGLLGLQARSVPVPNQP